MDFFSKLAEQFIIANRRLKKWQRLVSALAAAVVFVTTYALVLPAITLDKETASTQAGIKIAASENGSESGGTVYEAVPAEESSGEQLPEEEFGELQGEESEDLQGETAIEESGSESEGQEAEVSGEDNTGEDIEAADGQIAEEQATRIQGTSWTMRKLCLT